MGSSGSLTHPVIPARPRDAPITLRNPRREALSSHSEAPLGNSRCRASWKAGLPASSSSERQYSGPVFSALSCAMAASILSRTAPSSSFLVGQVSSSLTNCDLLSVVILATVPSLRGSFHFLQRSRHFRAGLSCVAAMRLGLAGLYCSTLTCFASFAPSGLAHLLSAIPPLTPWAVFFCRFAAFCSVPLSMGDCIGSISQDLVELRSQPMAAVPRKPLLLKPEQLSVTGAATRYIADADLAIGGFYSSNANPIFGDQVCAERILIGESAAIQVDGVDRRGLLVAHVKDLIARA